MCRSRTCVDQYPWYMSSSASCGRKRSRVVNGSHNLGYKASYANDENMVVVRGNRALAEAFTAHVLDVVNHYNWRYKRRRAEQDGEPQSHPFTGLATNDRWQDKYFTGSFLASRNRFFFPEGAPSP